MSELAGVYEELFNLLIDDDPLRTWLRALYTPPDPQWSVVRIWNGRAPKGYGPRLVCIGEPREDDAAAATAHGGDGNLTMIRLHLFTEMTGAFLVGAQGVEHLARILTGAGMVLPTWALVDGYIRAVTANEDLESQTYHTVVEWRGLLTGVG